MLGSGGGQSSESQPPRAAKGTCGGGVGGDGGVLTAVRFAGGRRQRSANLTPARMHIPPPAGRVQESVWPDLTCVGALMQARCGTTRRAAASLLPAPRQPQVRPLLRARALPQASAPAPHTPHSRPPARRRRPRCSARPRPHRHGPPARHRTAPRHRRRLPRLPHLPPGTLLRCSGYQQGHIHASFNSHSEPLVGLVHSFEGWQPLRQHSLG